MSLTSFSGAEPITVDLTLDDVTIALKGQLGFNPATGKGGSAFLHSWNNNGNVRILGSTFDEAGFLSTFNILTSPGFTPAGSVTISGNTFTRSQNQTVVGQQGNLLANVAATLTGNLFEKGSYLDLYDVSRPITLEGNTFATIAGGYGIRITGPSVTSVPTLSGTNVFTGPGLALKYVDPGINKSVSLVGSTTVNGRGYTKLTAGGQADDTIILSTGADWAHGDDGNDSIDGGGGNDYLSGGSGNDTLNGGDNNDILVGGEGGDFLNGGSGWDTASYAGSSAGVTVSLTTGTGSGGDAQGDVLSGIERLYGSAKADTFTGDGGVNNLDGSAGNDTLNGGGGVDTLLGGLGADVLTGGSDADLFAYNSSADSGTTDATRDIITDFEGAGVVGGDLIDLADIDADTGVSGNQPFTFIGTNPFTAAGQLRYFTSSGNTFVEGNTSGVGVAEFQIRVNGLQNFIAGDFVL